MTHTLGVIAVVSSFPVFAVSVLPGALRQHMKRSLFLIFCGTALLLNGLVMMTNPHLFDAVHP